MKKKKHLCESCGERNDQTHLHHILPKSKGGTDKSNNLIEVCPPCHQKIHNVDFNGDKGLIKIGIENLKQEFKEAAKFIDKNFDSIVNFCDDFYDEYDTEILHEMFRYEVLSSTDFVRILKGEKTKKAYGLVTGMIFQLYRKSQHKYSFVFV